MIFCKQIRLIQCQQTNCCTFVSFCATLKCFAATLWREALYREVFDSDHDSIERSCSSQSLTNILPIFDRNNIDKSNTHLDPRVQELVLYTQVTRTFSTGKHWKTQIFRRAILYIWYANVKQQTNKLTTTHTRNLSPKCTVEHKSSYEKNIIYMSATCTKTEWNRLSSIKACQQKTVLFTAI